MVRAQVGMGEVPAFGVMPSAASEALGRGRAGVHAMVGTTVPTVFTAVKLSHPPSLSTIAGVPAPIVGAIMPAIGSRTNGIPTQHRPRAVKPRTDAPGHTPRDPPPGASTGVSRTIGPGGNHTHSNDDENGVACAMHVVMSVVHAWRM